MDRLEIERKEVEAKKREVTKKKIDLRYKQYVLSQLFLFYIHVYILFTGLWFVVIFVQISLCLKYFLKEEK